METLCWACGSNNLKVGAHYDTVWGSKEQIRFDHTECIDCDEGFVDTHQIEANEERIKIARERAA